MDLKEIKALYKFFKGTDLVELETEGEGGKVRFRRGAGLAEESAGSPRPVLAEPPGAPALAPPVAASKAPDPQPAKEEPPEENYDIIISPMVGTFYRAPSPEAPPFIKDGDLVKKGQPVCLIEAMKLMNDVESEFNGKVVDIMVENGQPVEYGEPLVKLERAK